MRPAFDPTAAQLATRIPKALHRAARLAALEQDRAFKDWVAAALAEYLAALGGTPVPALEEPPRKRVVTLAPKRARASA